MNTYNQKTVYIAAQTLPGRIATSNHSIRLAKSLVLAGFRPILLVEEGEGIDTHFSLDRIYSYDGIEYVLVGENSSKSNPFGKWGYYWGVKQTSLLFLMKLEIKPFIVIVQSLHFPIYLRFNTWCKKNKVTLILETMEWHEKSQYKGDFIKWLDAEFSMRVVQRFHKKLLVISKYLENYYSNFDCQTFLLPPLIDTQHSFWRPIINRKKNSILRLMFAGSPVRERQDIILEAVFRLQQEGIKVTLEYLGSTRKELEDTVPDTSLLDKLDKSIIFHGRVPYAQVPFLMGEVDYAVLLREDAKWSRSCFPSKIPEFLSLGVPVICNITSDLGDYLKDGRDAFIVKELTVESFVKTVRRANAIANDEKSLSMRLQARKTAENSFDISCFSKPLADFLRKF